MADRQFAPLGTENAPAGWTLPTGLEIAPKIVYASFDGSGAAGTFLPCLRLISDSGHVAAECVATTQVAAGASADASWFRGVSAGGGSQPVSSSIVVAQGVQGGSQTVAAGTSTPSAFGQVDTSDATVLSWSTVTNTNDTLTLHNTTATVLLTASCLWNVGLGGADLYIRNSAGTAFRHDGWNNFQGQEPSPTAGLSSLMDFVWVTGNPLNCAFTASLTNHNGFDAGPQQVYFMAIALLGAGL